MTKSKYEFIRTKLLKVIDDTIADVVREKKPFNNLSLAEVSQLISNLLKARSCVESTFGEIMADHVKGEPNEKIQRSKKILGG